MRRLGSPLKNSEPYDKPFWDIFEISPFSDENMVNSGVRGSPPKFFMIGIFLLMLLGRPCTISEPYDKLFWVIFEISPFSNQNRVNSGGRGSPRKFYMIGIFLLMLLGSPCKHLECHDKPFWDIFEISPFSNQKGLIQGLGGVPEIFL